MQRSGQFSHSPFVLTYPARSTKAQPSDSLLRIWWISGPELMPFRDLFCMQTYPRLA